MSSGWCWEEADTWRLARPGLLGHCSPSLQEVSTWSPLHCSFNVAELLTYWLRILKEHSPKDCVRQSHSAFITWPKKSQRKSTKVYWSRQFHICPPGLSGRDIGPRNLSGRVSMPHCRKSIWDVTYIDLTIFNKYHLLYFPFSNMCWTAELWILSHCLISKITHSVWGLSLTPLT